MKPRQVQRSRPGDESLLLIFCKLVASGVQTYVDAHGFVSLNGKLLLGQCPVFALLLVSSLPTPTTRSCSESVGLYTLIECVWYLWVIPAVFSDCCCMEELHRNLGFMAT